MGTKKHKQTTTEIIPSGTARLKAREKKSCDRSVHTFAFTAYLALSGYSPYDTVIQIVLDGELRTKVDRPPLEFCPVKSEAD